MAEPGAPVRGALDEPGMQELAAGLGSALRPPLVIFLHGDLGAGKTTFVRALMRGLGFAGPVKSPTYGLLEHYPLDGCSVLHLDLYRVGRPGELEFLGIADLLGPDTVLLVEWPERGQGHLPASDVSIRFFHSGNSRELEFQPNTTSGIPFCERAQQCLKSLSS